MYSSSTRGSYKPVAPYGGLDAKHLEKLREFSRDVKPVFRYNCPSGYTHDAEPFDLNKPTKAQIAPNNVWFVDSHDAKGHACMPQGGWGTQPALGLNDELASMYRTKPGMDSAKISSAASSLMCDPCNRGRGRISKCNLDQAASMLSDEVSHIKEQDDNIPGTGLELAGGAKLTSSTACAINDLVKGLSKDQREALEDKLEQTLADHQEKIKEREKRQLECIVNKYNPLLPTGEARLDAQSLLDDALSCAQASADPSLMNDLDYSEVCSASPSCLSSMKRVTALDNIQKKVKKAEYQKEKHAALMKVYSKYHRAVKRCGVMTPADELKIKYKLECIVRKFYRQTKEYRSEDEVGGEVNAMFDSFKRCAPQCGTTAGCGDAAECVRSLNCNSTMCIPTVLDDIRKEAKEGCKIAPVADEMTEYMKRFYAKQRHLQNF
jgi:hypothetical protein